MVAAAALVAVVMAVAAAALVVLAVVMATTALMVVAVLAATATVLVGTVLLGAILRPVQTGGDGVGLIFRRGEIIKKVPQEQLVDALMDEIAHYEGE